jgi:hypothetical protein
VYAVAGAGHRQSYVDLLGTQFDLEPVMGRMEPALFRRLVSAGRLLFATLDDDMPSFAAVAAARSAMGRRTAGLFLRAEKCFERGLWPYAAKRWAFGAMRRLPGLTIAGITPFAVAPHHARVCHIGVCDPQYWDLLDGHDVRPAPVSPLSLEVKALAGRRRIVCAAGAIGVGKGLGFLADTLDRYPTLSDDVLVVAAGRVHIGGAAVVDRMRARGALIKDCFLSDQEFESLYGVADAIWACYAPEYDQASGVFGRAIQWDVRPIVRSGSIIAAFSARYGLPHFAVSYDKPNELHDILSRQLAPRSARMIKPARQAALVRLWQSEFSKTIGALL